MCWIHSNEYVITSIITCGVKLLIHSQNSKMQSSKCGNEWVISFNIVLSMWLLIHAKIKVKHKLVRGVPSAWSRSVPCGLLVTSPRNLRRCVAVWAGCGSMRLCCSGLRPLKSTSRSTLTFSHFDWTARTVYFSLTHTFFNSKSEVLTQNTFFVCFIRN